MSHTHSILSTSSPRSFGGFLLVMAMFLLFNCHFVSSQLVQTNQTEVCIAVVFPYTSAKIINSMRMRLALDLAITDFFIQHPSLASQLRFNFLLADSQGHIQVCFLSVFFQSPLSLFALSFNFLFVSASIWFTPIEIIRINLLSLFSFLPSRSNASLRSLLKLPSSRFCSISVQTVPSRLD
jgi:hypothetical protein